MTIKSFNDTKEYLFSRIQFGMKAGLENITHLCSNLGNPQQNLKCIHIAGTNGKGSTSFYISQLLTAHGYKTGLFTSPHLISVRERIRIDNIPISEVDLIRQTQEIKKHSDGIDNTFFETITAIAFNYFNEQKVDFVVLETGLGGRLDSTNICNSVCTIITSIALDHTAILGNTKSEILFEKLGIAKSGVPLLCNLKEASLQQQTDEYARSLSAPLEQIPTESITQNIDSFNFKSPRNVYENIHIANPGIHYQENAALALSSLEQVIPHIDIPLALSTLKNAIWPARMQTLSKGALVEYILDGGHNPAGIRAMLATLNEMYPGQKFCFLIAVLQDKDFSAMARLIEPYADEVVITRSTHEKSADPETCKKHFLKPATIFDTVTEALEYTNAQPKPVICTGSLYFMGDLIEKLKYEYSELSWFRAFTPDSNEVR